MSLDTERPSASQPEGDVLELDRPEQPQKVSTETPAAAAPAEDDVTRTEPKIGDAPGILFDEQDEARAAREKKKREAEKLAPLFEIEDIDSVLEHYKQKYGEEEAAKARAYVETLQKVSADKFTVPKRGETSLDLACDDILTLVTKSPVLEITRTGVHLKAATESSSIFYSSKGVQYNGAKKSFTAADAELMALHAAKRADLMPPAKVWLTGNSAEKKMIQTAIENINLTLPPEAQIVIGRTVGASLMDNIVSRFRKGAQPAEAPPSSKINPDHELFEAVLNSDVEGSKNSKIIGEMEVSEGITTPVRETAFSHGKDKLEKVHFVEDGDKFKVLAFQSDEGFGSYLIKNDQESKSGANASFTEAASGRSEEKPFIFPEEFVGPRTPPGWAPGHKGP